MYVAIYNSLPTCDHIEQPLLNSNNKSYTQILILILCIGTINYHFIKVLNQCTNYCVYAYVYIYIYKHTHCDTHICVYIYMQKGSIARTLLSWNS